MSSAPPPPGRRRRSGVHVRDAVRVGDEVVVVAEWWCDALARRARRPGLKWPAGAGGIGRAAVAGLVDVEAVRAVRRQPADVAGDVHAIAHGHERRRAADQAAGQARRNAACALDAGALRNAQPRSDAGGWRSRQAIARSAAASGMSIQFMAVSGRGWRCSRKRCYRTAVERQRRFARPSLRVACCARFSARAAMAAGVRQRRHSSTRSRRARVRVQVGCAIAQLRLRPTRERPFPGIAHRPRSRRAVRTLRRVVRQRHARASAANRQHRFSSSRTLPGQSCACGRSSAAGDQTFAGACNRPGGSRKTPRQQQDVAAPFARRRHGNHHVEAGAAGPARNRPSATSAPTAGAWPRSRAASTRRSGSRPPTRKEFAFGQHPQQPRLQRRRHVADLVEEQGAAVGLLNRPTWRFCAPVNAPSASWPNSSAPAVPPESPRC